MVAVEVVKSELVLPGEETPKHGLWLPTLDIMHAAKSPVRMIYVYRRPNNNDPHFFNVEALKAGLSKALVPFYPLAGRFGKDRNGRLEIDCRGQGGVLLVVARSESSIDEFGELLPSPEMSRMLTPAIHPQDPDILCLTQVTFLEGGTAILGTAWSHVVGDGMSTTSFLTTWSRMTRGITDLDVHPLNDRTLLQARSPPKVLFDHIGNRLPCAASPISHSTISILPLTKSQLALLTMNGKISTFCAVSAHVWRCVCVARGLVRDQTVRLNFPVNARRRMNPPLPENYFGNVGVTMVAAATVDYVISNPIEVVAQKIRDEIDKVNDEYVRSYIDDLEAGAIEKVLTLTRRNATTTMLPSKGSDGSISLKPEPIITPSATENGFSLTPTMTDFKIVSWLGIPLYGVDFGWGKPDIVRRVSTQNGGWVAVIMRGPKEDEVLVPIILEKENMETFKKLFFEGLNTKLLITCKM